MEMISISSRRKQRPRRDGWTPRDGEAKAPFGFLQTYIARKYKCKCNATQVKAVQRKLRQSRAKQRLPCSFMCFRTRLCDESSTLRTTFSASHLRSSCALHKEDVHVLSSTAAVRPSSRPCRPPFGCLGAARRVDLKLCEVHRTGQELELRSHCSHCSHCFHCSSLGYECLRFIG